MPRREEKAVEKKKNEVHPNWFCLKPNDKTFKLARGGKLYYRGTEIIDNRVFYNKQCKSEDSGAIFLTHWKEKIRKPRILFQMNISFKNKSVNRVLRICQKTTLRKLLKGYLSRSKIIPNIGLQKGIKSTRNDNYMGKYINFSYWTHLKK